MSLCDTFRQLSFRTFDHLGRARRVGHQPLEETFTDTNILELKERHPRDIYSHTFSKHEEGRSGADWEWWLTEPSRKQWLGLRVQAKVLHLRTDSFEHLHYRQRKGKRILQSSLLKGEARAAGLIPLYCFYLQAETTLLGSFAHCPSFPFAPESFGCSLATLPHIEALRTPTERCDLGSVIAGAFPWHCLVCCSGYGSGTLPERAWKFLVNALGVSSSGTADTDAGATVGVRSEPPSYVRAIVEGATLDDAPAGVRTILIVSGENAANSTLQPTPTRAV